MGLNRIVAGLCFLTIGVFSPNNSEAQNSYNPELLIPYNDHGKWGFSDTLGKIVIEPQFESASFFYESRDGVTVSYVYRGGEPEFYIAGKGIASPEGFKAEYALFEPFYRRNDLAPVKKSGKMGLFDYRKQQLMVDAEYSDMFVDEANQMVYLYNYQKESRGSNHMDILAYDVERAKSKKLKYVKVQSEIVLNEEETRVKEVLLFKDKNGRWYENTSEGWVKSRYTQDDFLEKEDEDDPRLAVAVPEPPARLLPRVPNYKIAAIDGAKMYSSIEIGRGNNYQVMWKDGAYGIYRERTQMLPFNYDFIDIDYENGFFFLLRNNKMGVYIPFTTYGAIQPKYDMLLVEQRLEVSKTWSFVLFKALQNGNEGYVGENGMEYFNFD